MRITVLVTEPEYGRMKAAAGSVPMSRWMRELAMREVGRAEGKTEGLPPGQKISTAEEEVDRRTVRRGRGPIRKIEDVTYPVLRKHLPEKRCTYLAVGDKKCPQCGKVHDRV